MRSKTPEELEEERKLFTPEERKIFNQDAGKASRKEEARKEDAGKASRILEYFNNNKKKKNKKNNNNSGGIDLLSENKNKNNDTQLSENHDDETPA
jgi:hypothetical protein